MKNINTQLLQAFIQLAEQGNYRVAAQQLFITQSALTKQVQTLEFQLGFKLFTRGRHGAQLTHMGELLLPEVHKVLHQTAEFSQFVINLQQGMTGNLWIGFGLSQIINAPKLVAHFLQLYPHITVTMDDMPSAVQMHKLLQGQLQLGFMRLPVAPPLTTLKLTTESLVLALASQHQALILQLRNTKTMAEIGKLIRDFAVIKLADSRGPGLNQQITQFMAHNHFHFNKVREARDIQTILALASEDMGIAFLPYSAVHIANDKVTMLALDDPYSSWDVGLVWHSEQHDLIRDRFIAMVENELPDL